MRKNQRLSLALPGLLHALKLLLAPKYVVARNLPPTRNPAGARNLLIPLGLLVTTGSREPAFAEFREAPHPFILWTQDEAKAIRKRIETEPWAKAQYEQMLLDKGLGKTFRNLFRFSVMKDESIVDGEKQYLLKLVGKHPSQFKGDTGGGRHYDQYLDVLRYDTLYDRLGPAERSALEDTFRAFIHHHLHEDRFTYTRTSWLPNMQWPRPMTAHLMSLALRDEKLIREVFASAGGWKYYFDDYVADGRFYFEEFGKQYSMIGEMLLWCRGAERLGLDELGYGYVGKGGATMRRYLESIIELGYPRVEIPGGLPHYPRLTMGDAKGTRLTGQPPNVFQHEIVCGHLLGGSGGDPLWIAANMNGRDHENAKVDKLMGPQWFEIAHGKWPDAGFDYFLAQMRKPGQDRYIPTLFWGLSPVDSSRVKPPPVASYIARERGFAMLRGEESPLYWESEVPAVGFQLATYYVHYVHDAFSLLGFYAYHRPIYLNRQISNGYAGGCPWTDSTRGHCGVLVDNLQWALDPGDPARDHPHWPNPVGDVPLRHGFDRLVKFVAARGRPAAGTVSPESRQPLAVQTLSVDVRRDEPEVFPGVDMTRALFLTREYLFDVFQLSSDRPRLYHWQVHALGSPLAGGGGWTPSKDLEEEVYSLSDRQVARRLEDPIERERYRIRDVRRLEAGDAPWSLSVLQTCALPDPSTSALGNAWYERRVGVRLSFLGEPGTVVYAGKTPVSRQAAVRERRRTGGETSLREPEKNKGDGSELPDEVGGTTILVERRKPRTVFIALHEPFEGGEPRHLELRSVEQAQGGLAVAVRGKAGSGIDDRILFRFWDGYEKPLTLSGGGESFTFADRAYIRLGREKVEASGDLRACRLRVEGSPGLTVNGREQEAAVEGGFLIFPPARPSR